MAANTAPRYTLSGDTSSNNGTGMAPTLTTQAADYDGTGANNKVAFTAGANGARICGLRFKAKGTNVQTVARVFVNNGSTPGTATNNSFIGEVSLLPTTISANVSTQDVDYMFPGGYLDLNPSFNILVGLGTTVAAGWTVTPINGGQF